MYLTKIPSSEGFHDRPGGTPGHLVDELQGLQSVPKWNISYNPAFVECGQHSLMWQLWQHEDDPFINIKAAEQDREFLYLCKEVYQGQGQSRDKDPTEESKRSLFHLAHRQSRSQSSRRHLPEHMVHALASVIKKSQLSTHRMPDFKLHNFLVPPPRKIVAKYTLNESTSFIGLLTVSQLNVRECLPKNDAFGYGTISLSSFWQ